MAEVQELIGRVRGPLSGEVAALNPMHLPEECVHGAMDTRGQQGDDGHTEGDVDRN
jgi:hypothetical protein